MSRIGALVFGVVVGCGLMYGGLFYHLLRTDAGFEMVPKASATLTDSYLDVRKFSVSQWADHQAVAQAVLKADKGHLLGGSVGNSLEQGMNRVMDEFRDRR